MTDSVSCECRRFAELNDFLEWSISTLEQKRCRREGSRKRMVLTDNEVYSRPVDLESSGNETNTVVCQEIYPSRLMPINDSNDSIDFNEITTQSNLKQASCGLSIPPSVQTNDSIDFNEIITQSNLKQESCGLSIPPPVQTILKENGNSPASPLDKCLFCHQVSEVSQTCSCPRRHTLCHKCVLKEAQDILLGDKKTRRIKCPLSCCQACLSDDELSKVLSPFTINVLEQKVDKEYLQYIKKWFHMSSSAILQTREQFALSEYEIQSADDGGMWTPMKKSQPITAYRVAPMSAEYIAQAEDFSRSLTYPYFEIVNLYRIHNPILLEFYNLKKSQMMMQCSRHRPLELNLYHGTSRGVIPTIVEKGFDWRLSGKNAAAFGQGTYFAKSAVTSHDYTYDVYEPRKKKKCVKCKAQCSTSTRPLISTGQSSIPVTVSTDESQNLEDVFSRIKGSKNHFMLVASVLVGDFTNGYAKYRRPPPVDISKPLGRLYDSCVDNVNNPEKFVVFDHTQAYPLYIIEYTSPENL